MRRVRPPAFVLAALERELETVLRYVRDSAERVAHAQDQDLGIMAARLEFQLGHLAIARALLEVLLPEDRMRR